MRMGSLCKLRTTYNVLQPLRDFSTFVLRTARRRVRATLARAVAMPSGRKVAVRPHRMAACLIVACLFLTLQLFRPSAGTRGVEQHPPLQLLHGIDWRGCTGACCSLPTRPMVPVSLLVVLPNGELPSDAALASWAAVDNADEITIVAWGACASLAGAAAAMAHLSARVRLVCAPDETASSWQPALARNLAVQLSTGRSLMLVTRIRRQLERSSVTRLLQLSSGRSLVSSAAEDTSLHLGSVLFDRASGLLAIDRGCWTALHGWDERIGIGRSAHTDMDAANVDLLKRTERAGCRQADVLSNEPPDDAAEANERGEREDGDPQQQEEEEREEEKAAAGWLLSPWHESRLGLATWRLGNATPTASASSSSWCFARASRRPPLATELLPNASEHARASLRLTIFRASRRSVPWPVLLRMRALRELRALETLHRIATRHAGDERQFAEYRPGGARAVGRVLLVHAQNALPRRLLAVCTAAALASEWRLPLAIAWGADAHLRVPFEELFEAAEPGTPLHGAIHLRSFVEWMAPADVFERYEQIGSESQRRANRVRRPTGERAVYVRAAGPIEASPAIEPSGVRACLRALKPTADASEMLQRVLRAQPTPVARPLGVHLCLRTDSDPARGGFADALGEQEEDAPPDAALDGTESLVAALTSTAAAAAPTMRCTADAQTVRSHAASVHGDDENAPPPLIASSECQLDSLPSLSRALDGQSPSARDCRNCSLAHDRLRSCSGERAASSRECALVTIVEWQLLARHAGALMLTTGSHFSRLVASTADDAVRIAVGCQTSGALWPPRPWAFWPKQPPSALLLDGPGTTPELAAVEKSGGAADSGESAGGAAIGGRLDHLVVNEAARLVFCYMPKVACTSWKMWLRSLAGEEQPLDPRRAHGPRNGLRTLAEYTPLERAAILGNYTKVVFVRDPWSRALSAYLNKFVEEPPERQRVWMRELLAPLRALRPGSAAVRAYGGGGGGATPALPFEGFLGVLEETRRAVAMRPPRSTRAVPPANEHWASQSELCGLHALRYDFVGRHEELPREAVALGSLLGIDATPPRGALYGWEGNRNASRLLPRYYRSRSLVRRVARLYAEDVSAPLNGVSFSAREAFGGALPVA